MNIEDLKPGMKIVCAHKYNGSFLPFKEGQVLTVDSVYDKYLVRITEKIQVLNNMYSSQNWSIERFEPYCQSCSDFENCIHKDLK